MSSMETRNVVKQYELRHNALLQALRPGGFLASTEIKAPCEALLVPRQVSLEATHIAPYLQAQVQTPAAAAAVTVASPVSPAPLLSTLFGETAEEVAAPAAFSSAFQQQQQANPSRDSNAKDAANLPPSSSSGAKAIAATATTTAPLPSPPSPPPASLSGVYVSPENETAFRLALTSFLEYHLLHFGGYGNSEFNNLQGQRGAFSEDLDSVKRFGHIGQVAVLADADPLLNAHPNRKSPTNGSNTEEGKRKKGAANSSGGSGSTSIHPASLQIFIIDRPLMDTNETRYIADALRKLTTKEPTFACRDARPLSASSSRVISPKVPPPPLSVNRATSAADLPLLMGPNVSPSRATATTATTTAATGIPTPPAAPPAENAIPSASAPSAPFQQRVDSLRDVPSGRDSPTETVVIDDFEEDAPEDVDLTPYVSKYTRISEQQRHRSARHRAQEEANAGANLTAAPLLPLVAPPTTTVGVAPASGNPEGICSEAAAGGDGATSAAGAAVHMAHVSLAGSSLMPVAAATPPPPSGACPSAAAPVAAAATHAHVLRHEYSRECIKDYRRVVAADNEIFYHEFERLMSLQCSAPLARIMSAYVSKNQELQQPILNNVKYKKCIGSCYAAIREVPRLSADPERRTILKEGIERYITARLYHQLYNVCEDEKRQNAELQAKFLRLENMSAEQLDALPEIERHHVWGQAMFELDGMDFFRSPREKLRCGMRACELLSLAVGDILRRRRNAKHPNSHRSSSGNAPGGQTGEVPLAFGADEFLPCFLLLVLRARPLSYVQNICFIEKFRYESLMSPEESYCFATLQSAMQFWLNCKDDGALAPSSTGSTTHAAAAATASGKNGNRRSSASVATLTKASAASCMAGTSAAVAPSMTERDLLPSLRHSSFTSSSTVSPSLTSTTATAAGTPNPHAAHAPPAAPPQQQQQQHALSDAPTVLDVLFGWANRGIAPPEEILTNNSASFSSGNAGRGSPAASTVPTSASPPPAPLLVGAVVDTNKPALLARVVGGDGAVDPPSYATVIRGGAATATHATPTDANTRARVRELLMAQHKTFEQLTLAELQLVVEEARQLLAEQE